MATEQERTLEALQAAIQMELDGKECYMQASQESGNEVGRQLLRSLAEEEDTHRQKFIEIYNAIQKRKGWPAATSPTDKGKTLRDLLETICKAIGISAEASVNELDALNTAIDKEKKSYDFYEKQSQVAMYDIEKDFYKALAAEEREHELILLDYYEYLTNPAGWFVKIEHPSLDGG